MYKLDVCQNGRVAMLPAATRNYVSSILASDLENRFKSSPSLELSYFQKRQSIYCSSEINARKTVLIVPESMYVYLILSIDLRLPEFI